MKWIILILITTITLSGCNDGFNPFSEEVNNEQWKYCNQHNLSPDGAGYKDYYGCYKVGNPMDYCQSTHKHMNAPLLCRVS